MATPKSITREALYNLVWSKPCRAIAKELGISDVAVGKICRKLEVPKPERGFWAKKAHGKAVKIIRLKPSVDAPLTTTIEGGQPSPPKEKLVRFEEAHKVGGKLRCRSWCEQPSFRTQFRYAFLLSLR